MKDFCEIYQALFTIITSVPIFLWAIMLINSPPKKKKKIKNKKKNRCQIYPLINTV